MNGTPLVSIVTPVFRPDRKAFDACVASVKNQSSRQWEWVLVDDASGSRALSLMLRRLARHPGITVVSRDTNGGIVAATNDGIDLARGEYIALLDHDDVLAPNAIERVIAYAQEWPEADYLYSDEDKVDGAGRFYDRFDKPDWSPERLLGQNYCSHLSVLRTSLVREVGGMRPGLDGAQDHDLVLRVTEHARDIVHIPEVLYHWRAAAGSTALGVGEKPYAVEAGRQAVEDALARRGEPAIVTVNEHDRYDVRRSPRTEHRVSVVIPTRGTEALVHGMRTSLVVNTVRRAQATTKTHSMEWIVVYDTGTPRETLAALRDMGVRLLEYTRPFNFADKCNVGALAATGDVLLLLNDDTEAINDGWLEPMLGLIEQEDVGVVGPLLRYESTRLQSAGHVSHSGGVNNLAPGMVPYYPARDFGASHCSSERTGVTGACLMIRREVYLSSGGMSPAFPGSFNDVDLCFRLRELGYRVVWTPLAEFFHFESLTRDPSIDAGTDALLKARWAHLLVDDEYYPTAPIPVNGELYESPFMTRAETTPW